MWDGSPALNMDVVVARSCRLPSFLSMSTVRANIWLMYCRYNGFETHVDGGTLKLWTNPTSLLYYTPKNWDNPRATAVER